MHLFSIIFIGNNINDHLYDPEKTALSCGKIHSLPRMCFTFQTLAILVKVKMPDVGSLFALEALCLSLPLSVSLCISLSFSLSDESLLIAGGRMGDQKSMKAQC